MSVEGSEQVVDSACVCVCVFGGEGGGPGPEGPMDWPRLSAHAPANKQTQINQERTVVTLSVDVPAAPTSTLTAHGHAPMHDHRVGQKRVHEASRSRCGAAERQPNVALTQCAESTAVQCAAVRGGTQCP